MYLSTPEEAVKNLARIMGRTCPESVPNGLFVADGENGEQNLYSGPMAFLEFHGGALEQAVLNNEMAFKGVTVKTSSSCKKPPGYTARANLTVKGPDGKKRTRHISVGTYRSVLDAFRAVLLSDAVVAEYNAGGLSEEDAVAKIKNIKNRNKEGS